MKENVIFPHKRVEEGRTLMKTNGDNIPLPPNRSPLGNATLGTKYVLLMNWIEFKLHVRSHKI